MTSPRRPDPDYTTIEGLQRHPLWIQITAKQQKFILNFIEYKGDRIAACKAAFRPKNDRSANDMATRFLAMINIRKLLAEYYGYTSDNAPVSRQEMRGLIAVRLREEDIANREFISLAQLYARLRGWVRKPPPLPRRKIDDIEPVTDEVMMPEEEDIDDLVARLEEQQRHG